MHVAGIITLPIGNAVVGLPVVPLAHVNQDRSRPAGGFFIDADGNMGITIDPRATAEEQQAMARAGVEEAYRFLSSQRPN